MVNYATHWRRVAGDGLIYDGPCVVRQIIFWPAGDTDTVDIYDGRDATSGEKFCRIEVNNDTTRHIGLGQGVLFGRGIYVDGSSATAETTVAFVPL